MTTKSPVELRDSSTQTTDEYTEGRSTETEAPDQKDIPHSTRWNFLPQTPEFIQRNPYTTAVVGGTVVAIGTTFAVPIALSAVGFTALGPAAGSYAAAWMSSIGIVQAGTWYSAAQSAAMGGAYAATAQGTAAAATGVATTLGLGWLLPKPSGNVTDSSTQTAPSSSMPTEPPTCPTDHSEAEIL
jgi:hypothetical protein